MSTEEALRATAELLKSITKDVFTKSLELSSPEEDSETMRLLDDLGTASGFVYLMKGYAKKFKTDDIQVVAALAVTGFFLNEGVPVETQKTFEQILFLHAKEHKDLWSKCADSLGLKMYEH